jgi:hypothetical protein
VSNRATLESALEQKCVEYAFKQGFVSIKLDKAARSWPDRMFLGPSSQMLLVEFKRPGFLPRKQQQIRHAQLAELGHPVSVITEFSSFTSLLDALAQFEAG